MQTSTKTAETMNFGVEFSALNTKYRLFLFIAIFWEETNKVKKKETNIITTNLRIKYVHFSVSFPALQYIYSPHFTHFGS